MAEWSNAPDCKSGGESLRWFKSISPHIFQTTQQSMCEDYDWKMLCGGSSVGRASAFQAEGREFESRLPLFFYGTADVAQG